MRTISFDTVLLRERGVYIAWTPQLDVSSCGHDPNHAREKLRTAVRLFLEEAERKGTLVQILEEAGYSLTDQADADRPMVLATERLDVSVAV